MARSPVAPDLEWYPLGRILLWISAFAALTTMAALLSLGTDAATISGTLRRGLLQIIQIVRPAMRPPTGESEQIVDALVTIAPVAGAIVTMTTLTLNLWLAAKITAISGRLHRPWPDLKSAALPPMTLAAFCVAIALCFTGGLLAIAAQIVAAALMMAYALTGFAVLHTVTLALKSRALWLACAYAIVVVFVWPVCCDGGSRTCRRRFRNSPALPARQAAARSQRPEIYPSTSISITSRRTNMEVILLERVAKLGQMGEVVRVKDGFARNFLLKRGKALRATADNRAKFDGMKAELEARNLKAKGEAPRSRRRSTAATSWCCVRPPRPASCSDR